MEKRIKYTRADMLMPGDWIMDPRAEFILPIQIESIRECHDHILITTSETKRVCERGDPLVHIRME